MNYRIMTVSLGCSKNRVDAEEMLGIMSQRGHKIVSDVNDADIVVVNTCGFIESAKQESIDETLRYARLKEEGKIKYLIMTGCLAQRYAKELEEELPGLPPGAPGEEVPRSLLAAFMASSEASILMSPP